jgi:hypothetical protein
VTTTHRAFRIEDGQDISLKADGCIGIAHLFVLTGLHAPNTHEGEGGDERKLFDVHGLN